MIFLITTAKQGGGKGRGDSGEDPMNGKEPSAMDNKKKKKKKKEKEKEKGKNKKRKKHEPQQLEHLLHPAHSQDLTLDKLPPRSEVLSRARRLRLITLRIGIDELFLAAYAQNREQHLRDWNHKRIW